MALLTESEVRQRATRHTAGMRKSAGQVLVEMQAVAVGPFDVFLSHSSGEPEELLLGVKCMLEDVGLGVYVDKYNDPGLSGDGVTAKTAEMLRRRMSDSRSLLYVHSQHSRASRWMPWELGFFDGLRGRVGVIPVSARQEATFSGQEYLGLYPYVDVASVAGAGRQEVRLWINRALKEYAGLAGWVKGTEEITIHP